MELYNFFSETITDEDRTKIDEFKLIVEDLQEYCEFVTLVESRDSTKFTIIGQIYGDDTNIGSTDLYAAFDGVCKYYWINANFPTNHNLLNS